MTRRDVDKLQEEIEELFADLWQVPRFSGLRHGFRPNVDCFHTDDPHALTVVVELPGVDPQSVRSSRASGCPDRRGRAEAPRGPGRVYQQMEIEVGPFQRQVRLAEDVDPEPRACEPRARRADDRAARRRVAPPPGRVTIEVWRA